MPAPFVNRILLRSIRARSVFNEKTLIICIGKNKFIFYSPLSMFWPYGALNPARQKQKRTYNNNNNKNPQRFDGDGPVSDRLSILWLITDLLIFSAPVEVFLRHLQNERKGNHWSASSLKEVLNKLTKDDVTSVRLLAMCWSDVQAHFPLVMKKTVEKELRSRSMID